MGIRIVMTGSWIYGGVTEMPVDIIALDYDWLYSLAKADDQLEPGETSQKMGPDGVLYYERFKYALQKSEPTWPDSFGHGDFSDAMRHAES